MKKGASKKNARVRKKDRLIESLFWLCISLLVLMPLVFSTAVYRAYVVPRYALLLVGSSFVLLLLALIVRREGVSIIRAYELKSRHIVLVCLYFTVVLLSTLFGTSTISSFFGSSYNQMGLLTRLCFFVFFIALIVAIGTSESRFRYTLWAMALTGLMVALYACTQFFGIDPFVPISVSRLESGADSAIRVQSTLGHSNYLGNFLLYTTLLTAGLALAFGGHARRIAIVATLLSAMAIILSGTRGAWVGLIAGTVVIITLLFLDRKETGLRVFNSRIAVGALIAVALIGFLTWAISTSPASRNVKLRAQSLVSEGFTGSGRTLLWRDSLRMIPHFALLGCGPEAFRKEFLAYKSRELARLAPDINNESSHNSYLDAAISFGLVGLALYVAVITSALGLIFGARRRCASAEMKKILTGLAGAMIAVIVHNLFIFDQIPTGFYFFAFIALAFVADRLVKSKAGESNASKASLASSDKRRIGNVAVGASCAIVVLALLYSAALLKADRNVVKAFAAANARDFNQLAGLSAQTSQLGNPTGAYDLLFAQALTLCAERIQSSLDAGVRQEAERNRLAEMRRRAIEMAITFAGRSGEHTATPDSNHLLLAYLGMLTGNRQLLRDQASEAVRLDPNFSNARWLMAEAYIADGDRHQAKQEALLAIDLNPYSTEARQALIRSQERAGRNPAAGTEAMISYARAEIASENPRKAENILRRAIRLSNHNCLECHLLLASIYETENNYALAIKELEVCLKQPPPDSSSEEITRRLDVLKRKLAEEK